MFSIITIHKCFNCLLIVLIFAIELSAMALPTTGEFRWNAEEIELVEMSDSAEDKEETAEHDLDKESTPIIFLANRFTFTYMGSANQTAADIAYPEKDVIVPPPER